VVLSVTFLKAIIQSYTKPTFAKALVGKKSQSATKNFSCFIFYDDAGSEKVAPSLLIHLLSVTIRNHLFISFI